MNVPSKIALSALAIALLSGCSDDDDDGILADYEGSVRVLHAVSDAPAVDVDSSLGDDRLALDVAEDLQFGQMSALKQRIEGSWDFTVTADLLTADEPTVLNTTESFAIERDTRYTFIAVGTGSDADSVPVEVIAVTQPKMVADASKAYVSVGHYAAGAPSVDVYVTAPDAALGDAAATLAYKQTSAELELAPGNYQVRVTVAGSTDVIFDSGTVTLAAGDRELLGALNNTGVDESPIVVVAAKDGAESVLVRDADALAGVRAVHAATGPAVAIVDVDVNGTETFSDFPYGLTFPLDGTSYEFLDAGSYDVAVRPDDSTQAAITATGLELSGGMGYTLIAIGDSVDSDPAPALSALEDDARTYFDRARVRLGHFASQQGPVDVYVVAQGAASPVGTADPLVTLAFGEDTDYLDLAGGSYDVYVTNAADDTLVLGPPTLALTLENGTNYLGLVAMDENGTLPTVIGLDGLAAAPAAPVAP